MNEPHPARTSQSWPRFFGSLSILIGAAYLVWRTGWTLNTSALWLAVPLLIAEVHGYLSFVLFLFMTWDITPPRRGTMERQATVDFFIPTYNEPYEVLALTVAGAAAMTYPHTTYVLDDGRRPWVKELCDEFGATYVTRVNRSGAKAGNINHALTVSSGEFIGVVDADFIPAPDYIEQMLGYFQDVNVAIVQAPQEFYNVDSFQHGRDPDGRWQEQSMFYNVIQPGKNRWNSPFWSGSPSMVRRRAIDDVGGVATETVTEDLHTSLRLHRRGWRLVYHNKVVALGIAPDDYDGFILQRLRWAQGAMQVIRREGFLRGLTIPQRLNYIASTGTYFDAYRKAIMFLVIPVMIVTDTLPVDAPGAIFLMAWGVQFLASQVALKSVSRGNYRLLWTEVFDTMKMFAFINASVALFSRKPIAFKVTPKGQSGDRRLHPFLYPFIGLVGLYLASIIFGVLRVIPPGVGTANTPAIVAGTIWAFLVAVVLVVVAAYGYAQVSRRRLFRVPVSVLVRYECGPESGTASVVDMTLLGCALTMPKVLPRGAEVKLWFTGATAPIIAKVVVSRPAAGGVGLVQASFAVEAGVSSLAPVVVSALWQHWRPGEFARQQGTATRLAA